MSLGVREHRTVGDDSRSATWARRTGTIAVGQSAVKGGQLVLAIVLVHALSPGHWARVAFLLSIHLAATTLGTGNLHHGLVFFLPRTEVSQRRALVAHTASLLAASGAFIAIVLVALAAVIAGPLDVAGLVPWIAVAILLELPTACAPMALLAVGAIRRCAAWDLTATALLLGAVIVPAAAGWGAAGVVRGLAFQAAARLVIFSFVVLPSFAGRVRGVARGTTAAHLRYGFPLGLTLAASVLNRSVDKWYVAAFDTAHVGVHAIAAQEIPLLAVLPYAGGAVTVAALVEAFRHRDLTTASGLWLRQTAAMSRVVVPVSVGLMLVAPEVFALAFPPSYASGVLSFRLFTAVTIHRVAEYGLVLRAADRNRDVLRSALVLLAANALFALVGAAGWGMSGASTGTLLANVVAWLFVIRRVGDALGRSWVDAFPWRAWGTACTCAALAAAIGWYAGRPFDAVPTRLAVELIVFVACYLGISRSPLGRSRVVGGALG